MATATQKFFIVVCEDEANDEHFDLTDYCLVAATSATQAVEQCWNFKQDTYLVYELGAPETYRVNTKVTISKVKS